MYGKTVVFGESWECHLDPECLHTGEFHGFPYNVDTHCRFYKVRSFRAKVYDQKLNYSLASRPGYRT